MSTGMRNVSHNSKAHAFQKTLNKIKIKFCEFLLYTTNSVNVLIVDSLLLSETTRPNRKKYMATLVFQKYCDKIIIHIYIYVHIRFSHCEYKKYLF